MQFHISRISEGVQVYKNGDVYEGEFHQGKCSGSGVYYYYMSGRYEGDWVDGKYDGYGVETWAKGSRYRGQYRQGMRHGYGVYRFYTGDVYTGEWSNGQSHGYGVHTCEDGSRYVGEFKWGVKHGLYHFRCSHYRRRCQIRAPSCNEVFDCRNCHNEAKYGLISYLNRIQWMSIHMTDIMYCAMKFERLSVHIVELNKMFSKPALLVVFVWESTYVKNAISLMMRTQNNNTTVTDVEFAELAATIISSTVINVDVATLSA